MDRDRILAVLRDHEAQLKADGLLHLRLFGSVARGEDGPESDIDLLADYDESRRITLLTLAHWRNQLTDLLGAEVHLSSRKGIYAHLRAEVLSEALIAF